MVVDRSRDVRTTEPLVRGQTQIDAEAVLDAVDDRPSALDAVRLNPIGYRRDLLVRLDPVPEQVEALPVVGLDAEFDPVDDRHSLTLYQWLVEGLYPIVVGYGDDVHSGASGRRGTSSSSRLPSDRVVWTCRSA